MLILAFVKKKLQNRRIVTFVLSLLLALPLLLLFNIIPLAYPIDLDDELVSLTIHSPFKEKVEVGWGGDSLEDNTPHAIWTSERWAYDLVMKPYDMGSDVVEVYGIYAKDIYAPVDGMVIDVYDAEVDILPNTESFNSMAGNYVYIKVEVTGTYLLMNHLLKDSVSLKIGDNVSVREYIGKVGNSGSTSEPHLYIHHQKQDPTKLIFSTFAEGLSLYFYLEDGKSVMPIKKDLIN